MRPWHVKLIEMFEKLILMDSGQASPNSQSGEAETVTLGYPHNFKPK